MLKTLKRGGSLIFNILKTTITVKLLLQSFGLFWIRETKEVLKPCLNHGD